MLYRIKPLEWKPDTWDVFTSMIAAVPFGWLTIRRDDFDKWSLWLKSDIPVGPVVRTLDEAKAAAEKFYVERMNAGLEEATPDEVMSAAIDFGYVPPISLRTPEDELTPQSTEQEGR